MADGFSWITPTNGATFSPVDRIGVEWKASKVIAAPSFRLCSCSTISTPQSRRHEEVKAENPTVCGLAVWPAVNRKDNEGTYFTSLEVPRDSKNPRSFNLRMEDENGGIFESPCFTLTPDGSSPKQDVNDSGSMALYGSQPGSTASFTSNSTEASDPPIGSVHGSHSRRNYTDGSATPFPHIFLSHPSPNPVSFAVPLAIVGCMFPLAVWLAIRHRRKQRRERIRDVEKCRANAHIVNQNASMGLDVKGYPFTMQPPPVPRPPFMPPAYVPRRSRKSVPMSLTYTNAVPANKSGKGSRPLSARSTRSENSAYLPPIVPTSPHFFNEDRDANGDSVAAARFPTSPTVSLPEHPHVAHIPK